MTDLNDPSPSSTSGPDETHADSHPSNSYFNSILSPPAQAESHIGPLQTTPACNGDANPWTCTSSDMTTSSTYGSTSMFDNESSG